MKKQANKSPTKAAPKAKKPAKQEQNKCALEGFPKLVQPEIEEPEEVKCDDPRCPCQVNNQEYDEFAFNIDNDVMCYLSRDKIDTDTFIDILCALMSSAAKWHVMIGGDKKGFRSLCDDIIGSTLKDKKELVEEFNKMFSKK